ncbi:MAG: hypothetical protein ACKV19_03690 [Verrucomicrobiales bacterium]
MDHSFTASSGLPRAIQSSPVQDSPVQDGEEMLRPAEGNHGTGAVVMRGQRLGITV